MGIQGAGLNTYIKSGSAALFVVAYCFLIGGVVAINAYILLPVLLAPLLLGIALLIPINNQQVERHLFWLSVLLLLAFLLWPRYSYIRLGGLPGITPPRIILAATFFLWFVALMKVDEIRKKMVQIISDASISLYLLLCFLLFRLGSSMLSIEPANSLLTFLNEFVFIGLLSVMFAAGIGSRENFARSLSPLLFVCALIFIIAIIDYRAQRVVLADYLPITSDYAEEAMRGKARGTAFRSQSTFDNTLTLAQFVAVVQPFFVLLSIAAKSKMARFAAFILAIGAIGIAWSTGSRAGLALTIFAPILMAGLFFFSNILGKKATLPQAVALVLSLIFASVLAILVVEYFYVLIAGRTAEEVSSTSARLLMLERAMPYISNSPFLGSGAGQASSLIGIARARGAPSVDSLPLSIVVESGFIALAAFVGLIFYAAVRCVRIAANEVGTDILVPLALATSLLIFFATTLTLSLVSNYFLLAFLIGCSFVVGRRSLVG